MKIHDKLWYIINPSREDNLAYMTYWEDDAKCQKRMETGRSWATPGRGFDRETRQCLPSKYPEPVGIVVDNSPLSGFNIGSSVCRWSTENKVFRVTDPRGFTVEVPTENISTLLHLTDVHKGIIQQECIWARGGNSHILLPVNSEPYLATLKDMDVLDNIIDIKELKLWDRIKLYEGRWDSKENECIYIGQYKANWDCFWGSSRWVPGTNSYEDKVEKAFGVYKDPKWQHYFLYFNEKGNPVVTHLTSPKIVKVTPGGDASEVLQQALDSHTISDIWVPTRVENLVGVGNLRSGYYASNRLVCNFHSLGERRK